jgi:Flp pilus assembly protein TadD
MALNTNPGHLEALQKLVDSASQLGKTELVVDKLQCYLRLHPNTPILWNDLGIAMANSGAYQEAENAFQQGLHYSPDDPALQENLSLLRTGLNVGRDQK